MAAEPRSFEDIFGDDDEPVAEPVAVVAPPARVGSICQPRWGNEKGYLALRDPFSGEIVEIPYRDAQPNWRREVTEN